MPTDDTHSVSGRGASAPRADDFNPYDRAFWLAYFSNTTLNVACGLLFRYADYVSFLGGGAGELGLIVGVGMVGALLTRVLQGVGIDRYGARKAWLFSLALFAASCLLHLAAFRLHSPMIYFARVLMSTALAGAFGASITHASLRAPRGRVAEVVACFGTSGFLGVSLGPIVGDLIFTTPAATWSEIVWMFGLSAALGAAALGTAALATAGVAPRRADYAPLTLAELRRHLPWGMLVVAVVVGVGLGIPGTFVRPFAATLGIKQISYFFLLFSSAAFVLRIGGRRMAERHGPRRMITFGLLVMGLSMATYLPVTNSLTLLFPAVVVGLSHAVLFPVVVTSASLAYPPQHRGVATTLVMAALDLGGMLGQPMIGGMIDLASHWRLPPYDTMFTIMCVLFLAFALGHAALAREPRVWEEAPPQPPRDLPGEAPAAAKAPAPVDAPLVPQPHANLLAADGVLAADGEPRAPGGLAPAGELPKAA